MKEFLVSFLKRLVGSYIDNILELIKIEATIYYLHGVRTLRRIFIVLALLIFFIAILAAGFVMVPMALLLFMPWSGEIKAIVAVVFAAAYILIPLLVVSSLLSEKRWLKLTRANELLSKFAKKRDS